MTMFQHQHQHQHEQEPEQEQHPLTGSVSSSSSSLSSHRTSRRSSSSSGQTSVLWFVKCTLFVVVIFGFVTTTKAEEPDNEIATSSSSSSSSILSSSVLPEIIQVHGSGTFNPFRCYGHVLEAMEGQSKLPTKMTYRATASGDGIKDFIGNITMPNNDFSSGDIPMSSEQYNLLKANGVEMLHLPVLLGPVGVFHSVPIKKKDNNNNDKYAATADDLTEYHLNMTSCLLARVFRRNITDWNHPDIQKINPNLDIPIKKDSYGNIMEDQSFPITIARRLLGSSSTFALTRYMFKSCPSEWPENLVGGIIDWPEGTRICQGSTLMIECIRDTEGTIGYLEAGLGIDEELTEVALQIDSVNFRNGDYFLTAENAIRKGGILPVLDEETSNIPESADADWSEVDLINQVQGYVYSWPMVLLTYIYVRKDLTTFLPDPRAQGLLVAFLRNMYNDDYVEVCDSRFGFTRVTGRLRELALRGIDTLQTSPDAPQWIMESGNVLPSGGQDDYVISTRRKRSSTIEQEILMHTVDTNSDKLKDLELRIEEMLVRLQKTELDHYSNETKRNNNDADGEVYGKKEEQKLNVSFILSILALCLWVVTFGCLWMMKNEILKIENEPPVIISSNNTGSNSSKRSKSKSHQHHPTAKVDQERNV